MECDLTTAYEFFPLAFVHAWGSDVSYTVNDYQFVFCTRRLRNLDLSNYHFFKALCGTLFVCGYPCF
uniref:Uncharacterized protein n=1 Tax=Physcomitrium patens TaxID=3218 RepID=A0A7I3ZWH1_PHYPA